MSNRPTKQERQGRLEATIGLLSRHFTDGQIKKAMARHYDISPRAIEPYLRCARKTLRQEAAKSREELRAEAYGFYRPVVRDQTVPTIVRLQAQKRIDKLLGLEGPARNTQTDTTCDSAGKEARDGFYDLLAKLRERAMKTDGEQLASNGRLRLPDGQSNSRRSAAK